MDMQAELDMQTLREIVRNPWLLNSNDFLRQVMAHLAQAPARYCRDESAGQMWRRTWRVLFSPSGRRIPAIMVVRSLTGLGLGHVKSLGALNRDDIERLGVFLDQKDIEGFARLLNSRIHCRDSWDEKQVHQSLVRLATRLLEAFPGL